MTTRAEKFINVVNSLGPLSIGNVNPRDGWPGIFTIQLANQSCDIALHVSSISPHSRASYELRFQNPAGVNRVVSNENGFALPILLGIEDSQGSQVFVGIDGRSRVGRTTRFSILFHQRIITEARIKGWAVYVSSTGEKVFAFVPMLFPSFIEQILQNEEIPSAEIIEAAIASGVMDQYPDIYSKAWAGQRATRAINVLVRKAGTGKRIRRAYDDQCAMCGLGSGLIQGAHIYPVEAPGSSDEVWNGLSLCYNHHKAFDLHIVGVNPNTYEILIHPNLYQDARYNIGTQNFISSTKNHLTLPTNIIHQPSANMFRERYLYFSESYSWM